ncbi:RuvC-like resolvase [Streptomyces phage LuckySocke]|jgi:Holliday junction resolvasome RuvABC endonuclease subunit|nr:RuvC-like resolvase [Streptomyces phage Alone3]WPH58895.1 RuvC-like resolvase [Streptomyces phage LuckySocke]
MTENSKSIAWVGLDQSYSGFGVVKLDSDGDVQKTLWKFPPKDSDGMRLGDIYVILVTLFTQCQNAYDEVHVAMEGYANGRTFNREKMGELGGIVKLSHASVFGTDPTVVPPTSLKKFVTGKGTASKDDMVNAVQSKWSKDVTNNNIADAYGLAEYMRSEKPC